MRFWFALCAVSRYVGLRWRRPRMWFYRPFQRLRAGYDDAKLNHLLETLSRRAKSLPGNG